jgi:catechol 2,3-dioxygenase-like lactoylglutathione lyase family enzyme
LISSITQVVLEVSDQDRARQFWTDVLGFELVKDETFGDERWVEIRPPEGGPLVVLAQRQPGRPRSHARPEHPSAPAMFGCRNLRATHQELAARGVRFAQPPVKMHFGWWSMFEDPEGTRYALGELRDDNPTRGDDEPLSLLVGRWRTTGSTRAIGDAPAVEIDAWDTYSWLPGGCALLHEVDAHVGEQHVEGAEIIGNDPQRGCYRSQYFGSDGPTSYTAAMEQADGSWVWSMRSDQTRFAGTFSIDLTHITGHWERLADDGCWRPWMDIELAR